MESLSTDSKELGYVCLNCGQATVAPNRPSIDNWSCNYCHSGFISFVMLSNLVPREFLDLVDRKGAKSEKQRPCPKCKRKMELIATHFNGKDLELDVCRRCRLLWFDSGELMRALRFRAPENVVPEDDDDEPVAKPLRTRDFRRVNQPAPRRARTEKPGETPWHTYGLIGVCLVLMPFALHRPDFIARFGMSPVVPFRDYGLTWVTSLFIHDSILTVLGNMFLLLLVGSHLEERIGMGRYARLFLVSGLFGRVGYLLASSARDPVYYGSGAALAGIVTYTLLTFPYRRVLFPSTHKYRSRAELFAKAGVAIVTLFGIYVGWNFYAVAIFHAAQGSQTVVVDDALYTTLAAWAQSPHFRAKLAGAGVGLLWCLVESVMAIGSREMGEIRR